MSNSWSHPRTDSPSLVEPSTHSTTDTSCSSRKPSVEKRSIPSSFVRPTELHFERAKLSSLAILVSKWYRQFPVEIPKSKLSIMKFARVKLASPTKPCSKLKNPSPSTKSHCFWERINSIDYPLWKYLDLLVPMVHFLIFNREGNSLVPPLVNPL